MQANQSVEVVSGERENIVIVPEIVPDIAKIVDAVVDVVDIVGGGRFGKFLSITAWEATRPRRGRVA